MTTNIKYKHGRICYNPELHYNHGKVWTVGELAFMCSSWAGMKKRDIALALGRTEMTVLNRKKELVKEGQFEHYRQLGERGIG